MSGNGFCRKFCCCCTILGLRAGENGDPDEDHELELWRQYYETLGEQRVPKKQLLYGETFSDVRVTSRGRFTPDATVLEIFSAAPVYVFLSIVRHFWETFKMRFFELVNYILALLDIRPFPRASRSMGPTRETFFPSDVGKVTWAHRVNSKDELFFALNGDAMMIEADILMGTVVPKKSHSEESAERRFSVLDGEENLLEASSIIPRGGLGKLLLYPPEVATTGAFVLTPKSSAPSSKGAQKVSTVVELAASDQRSSAVGLDVVSLKIKPGFATEAVLNPLPEMVSKGRDKKDQKSDERDIIAENPRYLIVFKNRKVTKKIKVSDGKVSESAKAWSDPEFQHRSGKNGSSQKKKVIDKHRRDQLTRSVSLSSTRTSTRDDRSDSPHRDVYHSAVGRSADSSVTMAGAAGRRGRRPSAAATVVEIIADQIGARKGSETSSDSTKIPGTSVNAAIISERVVDAAENSEVAVEATENSKISAEAPRSYEISVEAMKKPETSVEAAKNHEAFVKTVHNHEKSVTKRETFVEAAKNHGKSVTAVQNHKPTVEAVTNAGTSFEAAKKSRECVKIAKTFGTSIGAPIIPVAFADEARISAIMSSDVVQLAEVNIPPGMPSREVEFPETFLKVGSVSDSGTSFNKAEVLGNSPEVAALSWTQGDSMSYSKGHADATDVTGTSADVAGVPESLFEVGNVYETSVDEAKISAAYKDSDKIVEDSLDGAKFLVTTAAPSKVVDEAVIPKTVLAEVLNAVEVIDPSLSGTRQRPSSGSEAEAEEMEEYEEEDSEPSVLIPIMAHPPHKTSDLSFQEFIDRLGNQGRGIKLDFKDIEAVEPCLKILKEKESEFSSVPIWLNADIIRGPVQAREPLDGDRFLRLCKRYFPDATLSLGWTVRVPSGWSPRVPTTTYTLEHMRAMMDMLFRNDVSQPVTFPIWALFVPQATTEISWLLNSVPNSTLTIWGGPMDALLHNRDRLTALREMFGKHRVFYDLPYKLNF